MPEQITTVAELDALPMGSVIQPEMFGRLGIVWQRSVTFGWRPASGERKPPPYPSLPAAVLYRPDERQAAASATPRQITTVEQLLALPAECLLRSGQPGYGPSYLVTVDAGDGVVMYEEVGANLDLTAAEAIEEHAPLTLLHRPDAATLVQSLQALCDDEWLRRRDRISRCHGARYMRDNGAGEIEYAASVVRDLIEDHPDYDPRGTAGAYLDWIRNGRDQVTG